MSKANDVERLVITREELLNLECIRLLIHEVAGKLREDQMVSKHQLFEATNTLWAVVNLIRDKSL